MDGCQLNLKRKYFKVADHIALPWHKIQTVLLDMDGTLLDLHFDDHFWLDLVPVHYATLNQISIEDSKKQVYAWMNAVSGTLDWYCMDYWDKRLGFDVVALKHQVAEKIQLRPNTIEFLRFLRKLNKQIIMATNAHPRAMELKFLKADFVSYFDHISSSHDLGYPKEEQAYWQILQARYSFDAQSTLFIDDSQKILASAERYGIGYLLGIERPNSQKSDIDCNHFTGIRDFSQLF